MLKFFKTDSRSGKRIGETASETVYEIQAHFLHKWHALTDKTVFFTYKIQ